MFRKLLIANRGEIAVRIARACRELGISPVAVYSDADRASLHVRVCDQAVNVGPPPSTESYLVIDRIIEAARSSGAEAIHPGYGFLSENHEFAEAVARAGLTLVGPPASAMAVMGSKTSARLAAINACAPVVPGTTAPLSSGTEAKHAAEQLGFPVILKAAAGGGGKGMRLVRSADEIESALSMAQSEAAAAFNDSSVYIEKYIERPRHIEIQLLGDKHGSIVHLGERECSIQRRHQKVVEECPSPFAGPELRQRMGETAVRIATSVGYSSAGTMEFLVDQQRNFYFLEMNTRLQVEHPVTEMVVGRDLVHEQIKIAAGHRLSFTQDEVVMRGSAIECRIYAEDPDQGFLPSPGRITGLRTPSGPGVRDDSGVYEGWEVPLYYDPLLAKLCVWGETRDVAINRLKRALDEYVVEGIMTTLPFFRSLVLNHEFRSGEFDTGFIERLPLRDRSAQLIGEDATRLQDIAALAAILHSGASGSNAELPRADASDESRWRLEGRLAGRR